MIAELFLPILLQSVSPAAEAMRMVIEARDNPGWNCDDPQFQQEMNWCAGQDYQAADTELNRQWKVTAAAMKARDADFLAYRADEYDTREGWFESLLEAQRGWLRYRDAQCRVDGYTARGGSMEPLLALSCKARLTRLRTAELRELVEVPG